MPQELPLYVQINGRFYERIPEDAEPYIFCYVSNLQQRKKKSYYVTAYRVEQGPRIRQNNRTFGYKSFERRFTPYWRRRCQAEITPEHVLSRTQRRSKRRTVVSSFTRSARSAGGISPPS